jgi:methionine sulfoxide reductase catalytic subunit
VLIKQQEDIKSSEITDKGVYQNRRAFMKGAVLAGTTVATGLLYRALTSAPKEEAKGEKIDVVQPPPQVATAPSEPLTPLEDITNYNNFYEFSTDKRAVASKSKKFVTRPWTVEVTGHVNKPRTFDLDELLKIAPQEDRIYRMRCVEAWSMVIPWVGFPLAKILDAVEPTSKAAYVRFVTLFDPARMPNQKDDVLPWPYEEGLRLDEAMHPLTILSTGIYGETLLPQNGAPIRVVVPWKYGFKGIKSIVRIELVESRPPTTWNKMAPGEYGFYSNVNPNVDHPRWTQARETRIGEFGKRETLMFNGYADQVAHLYNGMDLRVNY